MTTPVRRGSGIVSTPVDVSSAGSWSLHFRVPGIGAMDMSTLRGLPVIPQAFSFSDPFGPKSASFLFPQVSHFDRRGVGDLTALRPRLSVDLVYVPPTALPVNYPFGAGLESVHRVPHFSWEGYTTGFSWDSSGLTVECKGGMYQLDRYFAKPEYWPRPRPYEHAIARQFDLGLRPHLRTAPMRIVWPSWWNIRYGPPPKGTPGYLIPTDVRKNDFWTGMLTRSSGSWEPVLTSYIQTMLASMYTRHGRWTLDLATGRVPVLLHRNMISSPDAGTVLLDLTDPTVELGSIEEDWETSLDTIYTQGTSLAGVQYSGMEVGADGESTYYAPAATRRQAWPVTANPWLDLTTMPAETLLQALPGLNEADAQMMAVAHLERFGYPGVTGTATLSGDVMMHDGSVIPHFLVRAGMVAQLLHLFGDASGPLAHITDSSTDLVQDTTTITFDSKYRDALTIGEVRDRGRDALSIPRMLVGGQYTPPVPDQLVPWNYAAGAGIIPAPPKAGLGIFEGMPNGTLFPWQDWTIAHPPSSARWKPYYIEIGPAKANADKNWSGRVRARGGSLFAIPVKMAQAGNIRLLQMAAYDRYGRVLPVPFHVSFYYLSGVNVQNMPKIPAYQPNPAISGYYPHHHPPFAVGQHYPYVVNAWEQYNPNGTLKSTEVPDPVSTAQLWFAVGNDKIRAGYFPTDGYGPPTGLLVDETPRSFDTTQVPGFDPRSTKQSTRIVDAPGYVFVMVYCDAQQDEPVYFLGRFFRADPGAQGGGG